MAIVFGFVGAILALLIFFGGVMVGWRGYEKMQKKNAIIAAKEMGEAERRRLQQEQDAFRTMLNYNAETAYGINISEYTGETGEVKDN